MSALNDAPSRLAVIREMPKPKPGQYLTLEELEVIAFNFPGFEILAAGDEWHLRVPVNGVQETYRAHRPVGAA